MSVLDDLPIFTDDELDQLNESQVAEVERLYELAFAEAAREDEDDWEHWLPWLFPDSFTAPFAAHHHDLWNWVWSIELGVRPPNAFVAIWPRGGAKSSSAEAACAALGARGRRRYGLYICETQQQADDHVGENVSALLESPRLGRAYPELGSRMVGKFGSSKGWRRNRLRTANGFTLDALGLDTAARGLKLEDDRPDLFIFDDLDNENDGPGQVQKKVDAITKKLLPAGAESPAILMIQNLIHPQGVFARLAGVAEIPADFLTNRIVSGPIPALVDATFDAQPDGSWKIVAGTATWEGQNLERCQEQVEEWGITSFRTEALHDTDAIGGGMFDHVIFQHCAREQMPALLKTVVWVDPAVTSTDNSDSMAIQVDGRGPNGTIYRLRSWERRASPVDALGLAIAWAMLEGALRVGVETDQGGDTWQSVYKEAFANVLADIEKVRAGEPLAVARVPEYQRAVIELAGRDEDVTVPMPHFAEEKAGSTQMPKAHRVQQMLPDYEKAGRIVHVLGTHQILERALFRFPRTKPFDLADASFWGWNDLRIHGPARTSAKASKRRMPIPALTHH